MSDVSNRGGVYSVTINVVVEFVTHVVGIMRVLTSDSFDKCLF